ncbi:GNAT family N-acetyltransferase [Simiduia sp. 21SJ11W-1]|uniref:GNAT family N-acetyltransferase n=1 Tax=Simiduia sp. 21SJ11W-1 TaxID=2909669 RepID=UPI0020A20A27|nr:GNAT family N-acetyltransferase [Simiduia sp. 21SJ11W-1]UTA48033.1 GNAT family N-acetyltransferase [Simiduia sp. 21SJ11W-1]
MTFTLRQFTPEDAPQVLALNAQSVHFLSPLDAPKLARLADASDLFWVLEYQQAVVGFVIGFGAGRAYESINYRWFNARLQRFLYIDRIVLSDAVRGQGQGQAVYKALVAWAQAHEYHWLAAEIDIAPANPASLKFHQQQGFIAVGEQGVGSKRVSLQLRPLG